MWHAFFVECIFILFRWGANPPVVNPKRSARPHEYGLKFNALPRNSPPTWAQLNSIPVKKGGGAGWIRPLQFGRIRVWEKVKREKLDRGFSQNYDYVKLESMITGRYFERFLLTFARRKVLGRSEAGDTLTFSSWQSPIAFGIAVQFRALRWILKSIFERVFLAQSRWRTKTHQIRGAAYLTREWVLYVWLVVDFYNVLSIHRNFFWAWWSDFSRMAYLL